MVSVIFLKALRKFLQNQQLNLIFSLVKIVFSFFLIITKPRSCLYDNYDIWVDLLIL